MERLPRLCKNGKTHELALHLILQFHVLSPEHGSHLFPMIAQARDLGNQDVQNVLEMMMIFTHVDVDSFPFESHIKKAESTLTNGRAYSSFEVSIQ
jgi:hypothetical protein